MRRKVRISLMFPIEHGHNWQKRRIKVSWAEPQSDGPPLQQHLIGCVRDEHLRSFLEQDLKAGDEVEMTIVFSLRRDDGKCFNRVDFESVERVAMSVER